MEVVVVGGGDAEKVKAVRLAALRGEPEAFGSTYAAEVARPPEFWRVWAQDSEDGLEQRTFALVAEAGAWVGLALVRIWPARPDEAELLAMYVAPEARGGGGAQALCDACAEWTRSRGVPTLALAVFTANDRARRAYEKAGFVLADGEGEPLRMERSV